MKNIHISNIYDFVKSVKYCHSERGTSEESLLSSRPTVPEGRAGRRFFFASLIRMTHMITFYETIKH